MKKLLTAVFASLLLLAASGPAQAVPAYYTFDGTIEYAYEQTAGLLGDNAIGDSLSYTWMIDFDADGTYTAWDGTTATDSDYSDASYSLDYFYTDYIGGSVLTVDGGYYENLGGGYAAEYNTGLETDYTDPSYTDSVSVFGEDDDDFTLLSNSGGLIEDLFVEGTTGWFLYDRAINADNQWASIRSANMVLTSISDTNPLVAAVPEPATILLLGSGLIGLGFFRRKTALRQAQNRL